MRNAKSVSPTMAYQGQTVHYEIELFNYSNETWALDEVTDYLPYGFYQVGGNNSSTAVVPVSPRPYYIDPGTSWAGQFDAHILQVSCSSLPRTIYNEVGMLEHSYVSPQEITMWNATRLAPLRVEPNIQVDLIPYHYAVVPGDYFTYTLHLNNVSPIAAYDASVTIVLDEYFSYLSTVSGSPAPSEIIDQNVTWSGLSIPARSERSIRFRVRVDPNTPFGKYRPDASMTDSTVCLGRLGTGPHPLGDGEVYVVESIVSLDKDSRNDNVPPLGLVDYDFDIVNEDAYDFPITSIVDIMPTGFTYDSMAIGPAPSRIVGNRIYWDNLVLSPEKTEWRVRLRAASLYGAYQNEIQAKLGSTILTYALSDWVYVGATVDLKKDVSPLYTSNMTIVPYTITVVNNSDRDFSNIIITDTLPMGFTYMRNRSGPLPASLGPNRTRPVWQIPLCKKSTCIIKIAFDAFIGATVPIGRHVNQVVGTSPDGSIPGPVLAPITITHKAFLNYIPFVKR
jgi:uncharacterized repeat protein (TIGR01451 family)